MNKVSMDKKYKCRNGNNAKVIYIGFHNPKYAVVALISDVNGVESACSYTLDGKYYHGTECPFDLIEVSPYADFKIDDKVIVWNNHDVESKYKRHFAYVDEKGRARVFNSGATSFTTYPADTWCWDNCELYKEE